MGILQKLKLLAVQCAGARAFRPRRWRRPPAKKLYAVRFRRLLWQGDFSGNRRPPGSSEESRGLLKQRLADLFAESPISQAEEEEAGGGGGGRSCGGNDDERWAAREHVARRVGGGGWRFGAGLRCRLLRRHWRPVLLAIPESD